MRYNSGIFAWTMRKRSMLFAWAADLKDNKPTVPEVTTWREMAWVSEWTHKEENTAKGRERQSCLKIDTSAFSVIWANNLFSFLLKSSLNPFSVPGTNWDHSFWVSELDILQKWLLIPTTIVWNWRESRNREYRWQLPQQVKHQIQD